MRSATFLLVFLILTAVVLRGCQTGYMKSWGKWQYVVINAAVGREVRSIDADLATFRVLADPEYACDKNHVFKHGRVLDSVDGATFEFLEGNHYARDAKNIYYYDSIVLDADRNSFRVLAYPYARDAKNIYCGSLRMNVDRPDDFKVLTSEYHGTSFFYSTDDLVKRLGPEFANHQVKYDSKTNELRFRVALSESGSATDGVWLFTGPKRSHRVK